METKIAIFLVPLFLLLGQTHSVNFKIEKFSEKDQMGVLISYGAISEDSDVKEITLDNSRYACLQNNNGAKLTFPVASERGSDFTLFISEDSSKFKILDRFEENVEWEEDDDICFLIGTWWPSESNTEDDFELYLSFLGSIRSIEARKVIYLNAALEDGFVTSSLSINKDEKSQIDSDALAVAQNKIEDQIIVGNVRCKITYDSPFFMYLDSSTFSRLGYGELKMVFIINEIKSGEEELAAKKLAERSSAEVISTPWANLECGRNWIEFGSKYEFPSYEPEQDDRERRGEDDEGFGEFDEKHLSSSDDNRTENDLDRQSIVDFFRDAPANDQSSGYAGDFNEDEMLDEESEDQLFTDSIDDKNKII